MLKQIYSDSDNYEIYEFTKAIHKQFSALSLGNSDNINIRKLADKFFDDVYAVLYPDEQKQSAYEFNDESIYSHESKGA